ncbi:MAG: hypothetical protein MJ104_05180 [Lachnospiraceae bacterium]|nr:hypothetical protein [Lachnospiraceae bacterium]
MKLKPSATRITIVITILILAVVAYYAYLSNKSRSERAAASMTVVEEVLSRDLNHNYPPTPKEVIKYYNDITKCLYNETCTDEEIERLGMKNRQLYDADLLAANEMGSYLIQLQSDVADHKDKKITIINMALASSTNVDYYTRNGFSFARLICTYTMNENGTNNTTRIVYLLRRDDDKQWKIYGWDFAENVDINGDGIPGD